jgi:hypothetical protein
MFHACGRADRQLLQPAASGHRNAFGVDQLILRTYGEVIVQRNVEWQTKCKVQRQHPGWQAMHMMQVHSGKVQIAQCLYERLPVVAGNPPARAVANLHFNMLRTGRSHHHDSCSRATLNAVTCCSTPPPHA